MLPIKIELTKELSVKLRDLRLNNPVDGTVLTAENLSKAIGNNRAWMSQIESGRLKNIKREDLISIYKLLFHLSSNTEAENKAEKDLIKYLVKNNKYKSKYVIAPDDVVLAQRTNDSPPVLINKSGKKLSNIYKEQCKEIYHQLIDFFENESSTDKQLKIAHQIQHINSMLYEGNSNSLDIISAIPFNLYKYADSEELKQIQKKINSLSDELNQLQTKKLICSFEDNINYIETELIHGNRDSQILTTALAVGILELGKIIFSSTSMSLIKKIECTNQYIYLLNSYANRKNLIFSLEQLESDASLEDIKQTLDYMQSFINGLKGSYAYLSHHVSSDYYDD